MKEKVLVTGGAGFIGSHLVDRLIRDGYEAVVVDDLSTGFEKNINPACTFYKASICDRVGVEKIFSTERIDYVFHLAAQMDVRKSVQDPIFDAESNIIGSLYLILDSVRFGIKKFVYASTGGAVYGEPQHLPVSEAHPINPISQYGISKHTVEHYLYLYSLHAGLKYTVLRYPNVYGPRQNPKGEAGVNAIFIGLMLSGERPVIFGDGEQLRDYVFVSDVVEANMLALTNGENQIYNIGSGVGISVNDIYSRLSTQLGFRQEARYAPARAGEISKIFLESSKARRELGWKPEVGFDEGLGRTLQWFSSNIERPSFARR